MECQKCGKCCYLKFYDYSSKQFIDTGVKCEHLTDDNLCNIFNDRPSWCLNEGEMKELDLFAVGCGLK